MEEQWNVICYLAELFESNNIEYQFDASTSVFIHGIEFVMDDIDVVILKQYKEKVKRLLSKYEQTNIEISNNSMEYFFVQIKNQKVHLMFPYLKTDCIDETRDISHNGVKIHTKTMEFYRRYIKDNNPLLPLIDSNLNRFV
jgi:hypothetical protein